MSRLQAITWVQILLLSIILWDLYTSQSAVFIALQMFVLGSYVVVGSTLINYLSGETYYYERFSAAGTHPDDVGTMLALALPAAIYLALLWRPRHFRFWTVVNLIFILVAFAGIALSGTRTALIAAIPGALFGLVLLGRVERKKAVAFLILLLVAGVMLASTIPSASFERLGDVGKDGTSGDLNGRIEIWQDGLQSFQQHPFLGIGSNMYRSTNLEGKVAHNSFVSVLVELGLVGFAVFGMVIFSALRDAFTQPIWQRRLWLTMLVTWSMGAAMLTWEHRKPTWLLLNLIVISAAAISERQQAVADGNSVDPTHPIAA